MLVYQVEILKNCEAMSLEMDVNDFLKYIPVDSFVSLHYSIAKTFWDEPGSREVITTYSCCIIYKKDVAVDPPKKNDW